MWTFLWRTLTFIVKQNLASDRGVFWYWWMAWFIHNTWNKVGYLKTLLLIESISSYDFISYSVCRLWTKLQLFTTLKAKQTGKISLGQKPHWHLSDFPEISVSVWCIAVLQYQQTSLCVSGSVSNLDSLQPAKHRRRYFYFLHTNSFSVQLSIK